MTTYNVELKRTSYVTIVVEGETAEEAEEAAWLELQTGDYDTEDYWEHGSTEEAQ